jgi:act minimal PKS acyl carrier protein
VAQLTIEELCQTLREAAGPPEPDWPEGDLTDVAFSDVGYDSLARLEAVGRITRKYDIDLPDDEVFDLKTPGELVAAVNDRAAKAA